MRRTQSLPSCGHILGHVRDESRERRHAAGVETALHVHVDVHVEDELLAAAVPAGPRRTRWTRRVRAPRRPRTRRRSTAPAASRLFASWPETASRPRAGAVAPVPGSTPPNVQASWCVPKRTVRSGECACPSGSRPRRRSAARVGPCRPVSRTAAGTGTGLVGAVFRPPRKRAGASGPPSAAIKCCASLAAHDHDRDLRQRGRRRFWSRRGGVGW